MKPIFKEAPNKTYKTYANAVKALEKLNCTCEYIIASTPEGRFYPIVRTDAQSLTYYAHKGVCVIM